MGSFDTALEFTLEQEGGLAFLKGDPGGLTNCGVTQATYDSYLDGMQLPAKSVSLITPVEVRDVYCRLYWIPAGCESMPVALAVCLFDTAVHSGVRAAIKMLQEAAGVKPDGVVGPLTQEALADTEIADLIQAFLQLRSQLLVRLSAPGRDAQKFRKGWLNRVQRLQLFALSLV